MAEEVSENLNSTGIQNLSCNLEKLEWQAQLTSLNAQNIKRDITSFNTQVMSILNKLLIFLQKHINLFCHDQKCTQT